jgi:hypothetical protein
MTTEIWKGLALAGGGVLAFAFALFGGLGDTEQVIANVIAVALVAVGATTLVGELRKRRA